MKSPKDSDLSPVGRFYAKAMLFISEDNYWKLQDCMRNAGSLTDFDRAVIKRLCRFDTRQD